MDLDLVKRDDSGQPQAIRDQFAYAMLPNQLQKQRAEIRQQARSSRRRTKR